MTKPTSARRLFDYEANLHTLQEEKQNLPNDEGKHIALNKRDFKSITKKDTEPGSRPSHGHLHNILSIELLLRAALRLEPNQSSWALDRIGDSSS